MARAFVFDAYGTLFDVHTAIAQQRAAIGSDADRFSELWRAKQLEYTWTLTLAGRYVDFWTLTQQALDFAFARFPSVDRRLRSTLLDCYMRLDPFSDARPALRDLKTRGYTIAILSNGTPKMLATAVGAAGIELDAVLSVDPIGMFKPRPETYRLVVERLRVVPADIVFVSSNRWDIMGAAAFGFRTAWVNRGNAPEEYEPAPDSVLPDLGGLKSVA
jgi:2-haloacid dehalogenase